MCAQNSSSFPKARCFLPPHSITCFLGAPKPTAARTQNPAGSRRTCFLAGCDSLYPGGRWVRKTVLKLRPCFPRGLSTTTPPPTRPHRGPRAASAVIRSHAEGPLEAGLALSPCAARQAAPSSGSPGQGCALRVCASLCLRACAEAAAGPPHTCRGRAHVVRALSTPSQSRHLGWELRRPPLVSPAPAAEPPLDSGLEGVQASPIPTLTRPQLGPLPCPGSSR